MMDKMRDNLNRRLSCPEDNFHLSTRLSCILSRAIAFICKGL